MKQDTIIHIAESYINGNISDTKQQVKKMTKADFITFLEHLRSYGIMPYKVRHLVE